MTPGRPELVRGLLLGDRYVLTSLLGTGGMGQVWVARDLRLDREVAVKLVPLRQAPGRPGDSGLEAPGAHEARLLAALAHPNIVSVYDVGGTGGWTWIVMELVRGDSLAALLVEGPLPVGRAVRLLGQVLEGLHAAHLVGVVHGDVKPSNILVDRVGVARLVDFGIGRRLPVTGPGALRASRLDEEPAPGIPDREETLLGTPGYVAPETAALGGASVSGDIWAAGVVLWECVAGTRAVRLAVGAAGGSASGAADGGSPASARAGRAGAPLAADSLPVGAAGQLAAGPLEGEESDPVVAAVAAVVRRAVAPAPAERFPSAAAMRRALADTGALGPGGPRAAPPELRPGPETPTRLVAAGVSPGAAGAAAGAVTESAAASHGPYAPPTQAFGPVQDATTGPVQDGSGAPGGGVETGRDELADVSRQPAPSGRGAIVAVAIVAVVLLVAVVVVVLALLGGRNGRPAADPIHAPAAAASSGAPSPG